uniref:Uncharacterized protein n=1 Tax=Triticum urartu TaxID=4572 RepID=A0A8R7PGC7_TRIUA
MYKKREEITEYKIQPLRSAAIICGSDDPTRRSYKGIWKLKPAKAVRYTGGGHQKEKKPSLMQRAQTRTARPAPMHCVLDTTVCWYASTVMAAPTHPSRSPVMFRSMLPPLGRLLASLPRLPVLLSIDFFSCLFGCFCESAMGGGGGWG